MSDRIAILLSDLHLGGTQQVRILLAHEFVRRGYAVDFVLARRIGALLSEVPSGARVIDLRAKRLRGVTGPLARYLRRERPGLLLAATWPLTAIAPIARRIARTDTKLVLSEHTQLSRSKSLSGFSRILLRSFGTHLYRMAEAVVTVSKGARRDLCEITGLREDEVTVIYNGTRDPEALTEPMGDALLEQWRSESGPKLLAVGSLKDAKNYPNLLRALAILHARGLAARLLILGEGPKRGELEGLVAELGLSEFVSIPGSRRDIHPFLATSDVFVLSSDWEGLPGSLIEALKSGVPVVSTDCPSGPGEILDGGRFGILVPPDDSKALAQGIIDAINQPARARDLDAHLAQFSIERAADAYLSAFD